MSKYAIVEDGIVTNVIESDEHTAKMMGFVSIPEFLNIGDRLTLDPRGDKEKEISAAAHEAIKMGMDVETSAGREHFSLTDEDQINLNTAFDAIEKGAAGYPYHSDKTLCRLYSADEIRAIAQAAIEHKLYHTTLCNHLLTWVRRAETIEEIESITYSTENLPEDLAKNMADIFTAVSSV